MLELSDGFTREATDHLNAKGGIGFQDLTTWDMGFQGHTPLRGGAHIV